MYLIEVKRTPIGKFLGTLSHLSAPQLTQPLFAHFLAKYPFLKTQTDEVIMGNVLSAGIGMNPARIAASLGGLSYQVPSYTLNQVCASSMSAVIQACRSIRAAAAHLILAGGMESMSQAPHLLHGVRQGIKYGSISLVDSLAHDGLYCSLSHLSMGGTAEIVAQKYKISRNAQDNYALRSHRLAVQAQKHGLLAQEIIPLLSLATDEGPRPNTSIKKLRFLKPAFKTNGTVTAGNASSLNDGASLTLVASKTAVNRYDLKPQAKIIDGVFVGVRPELMGLGPIAAIQSILKRNALSLKDIDVFEINEAFAVQVLTVMQVLKIPQSRVNRHGGAIALGHPLGMRGVLIIGSLINVLRQTGGRRGIASLCIGGGQGAAVLIEIL